MTAIPVRIPEQWEPAWFRRFYVEVLANGTVNGLVTHNADPSAHANLGTLPAGGVAGQWLVTNADNNFSAEWSTLGVPGLIDAHKAETDPHPDLIDDLDAASAVALTDKAIISQSGTNVAATIAQIKAAVFGEDWDDLRFPMNAVDPAGITGAATRITSLTDYTGALSFSGTIENVCAGIAQMPHAWKRESAITPHIHWTKPTGSSSEVQWRLYLRVIGNPGDTAGAWSSALSPVVTVGDPTVSDEHLLTAWAPFDMTGLIESAVLYWRLHRLGNADADNTAVICHELDFHYQTDKAGTDSPIPEE